MIDGQRLNPSALGISWVGLPVTGHMLVHLCHRANTGVKYLPYDYSVKGIRGAACGPLVVDWGMAMVYGARAVYSHPWPARLPGTGHLGGHTQ